MAQEKYHKVICGNEDVEQLGRGEASEYPSEELYFRLLVRALAMAKAQNVHPLDLFEVKYLWGDYTSQPQQPLHDGRGKYGVDPNDRDDQLRTLPFTFHHNIVLPFRLLLALGQQQNLSQRTEAQSQLPASSPFSPHSLSHYDTWIVQTLYAKFRSVASARQSTWDGKPEVAAVHPLWCLANHSCEPNVTWKHDAQSGREGEGTSRERLLVVRDLNPSTTMTRTQTEQKNEPGAGKGYGSSKEVDNGNRDEDKDKADDNEKKNKNKRLIVIKAGQEILNHYCDLDLPVNERREYMLGSLGGLCRCERCLREVEAGEERVLQ